MAERPRAPRLSLPLHVVSECAQLLESSLPREACALLIGTRTDEEHRVEELSPIVNIAERDDAFQLDPVAWRLAEREASAAGLDVLGVWHSHPRTSAAPSSHDRLAAQEGWSHAISSGTSPGEIRSFHCEAGRLVEQRVRTRPQLRSARL